jgi:hypothetical protein
MVTRALDASGTRALLAWSLAYQRPLWRRIALRGPLRAAPVASTFLLACLLVSLLWATPGSAHRWVAACCGYRGWRPGPTAMVRLAGSALLLRHEYEVLWTIAATLLVTAPFEAWVGSARMLVTIALGHVVPTVLAAGLPHAQRLGGGGLDVGASAVVVAAAAGLAIRSRSVPVVACLVVAQLVALSAESPLANAEHLTALGVGALVSLAPPGPSGITR